MRDRKQPPPASKTRARNDGKERSGSVVVPFETSSRNDRLRESKDGRIQKTRRKELAVMGSAVVLLLALSVICLLFFFKVQNVTVVNSALQRYTAEELIEASGIKTGDSMVWLKEASAEERLLTTLPFLETAKVEKKFPSRVEISVTYARPAMAIKADDGYILLNVKGKVLKTGAATLSDYVAELRGVTVADATPGKDVAFTDADLFFQVTTLAQAFADAGYLNVTVYDVSDLQNITVEVDYKIDVKLGNISKVEGKLAFGKEVISRSLENAKHTASKVVVDLTNENTAYVRNQVDIDAAAATTRAAEKDAAAPDAEENKAPDEEADGYDEEADADDVEADADDGYDESDEEYDDED